MHSVWINAHPKKKKGKDLKYYEKGPAKLTAYLLCLEVDGGKTTYALVKQKFHISDGLTIRFRTYDRRRAKVTVNLKIVQGTFSDSSF